MKIIEILKREITANIRVKYEDIISKRLRVNWLKKYISSVNMESR